FIGKSMLERILQLRKQIGFVDKLSRLKMRQILKQLVVGYLRDRPEQIKRNNDPDHSSRLKKMFLFGRQSIDTIGHDILHRARDNQTVNFQPRPVSLFLTAQYSGFYQRPDTFFGKEGIAFSALGQ